MPSTSRPPGSDRSVRAPLTRLCPCGSAPLTPRDTCTVVFAAKEDPLLTNATSPLFAWFQSFILLEVIFQLPVFFLGVRGLWKRASPSRLPALFVYALAD